MTTKKDVIDLLGEWRDVCFFENQLTLAEAAASLEGEGPRLVEARPGVGSKASTWTIFDVSTNEEAILVHAAVWDSNTDLETGNFVPPGEKASPSLSESRVQNVVNFKCDVSYTLNTAVDESFYDHIQTFETYMLGLDDFNKSQRERSRWQDGTRRSSYIISSKLFVRKAMKPRAPDFEPHVWLKRGLAAQKREDYVLNPDKPFYFDLVEDTPILLAEADPPRFQKGDLVWFAFRLSFFVSKESWSPEVTPIEFMRVAFAKDICYDGTGGDEDLEEVVEDAEDEPQRLQPGRPLVRISRGVSDGSDAGSVKRKSGDISDAETVASEEWSVTGEEDDASAGKPSKARKSGKSIKVNEAGAAEVPAAPERIVLVSAESAEAQHPVKKKLRRARV